MPGIKMFPRMNYQVTRGLRELFTINDLTDSQWELIKKEFNYQCVYCGNDDTGNPRTGIIPDHLISSAENGDFTLGNVVPACQACNDKKGKLDWREFLKKNFEDSTAKIKSIETYLKVHNYKVGTPEDRLAQSEIDEYYCLLNDWKSLWERAQKLRDMIQNRRDGGS